MERSELSFSTANQQALALHRPAGLAAQCPFEGGYSYFHRTVRHAGAFELGVMLPYAYRTALEQRAIREDPVKRRAFEDAFARHDGARKMILWTNSSSTSKATTFF